jgi:hypothetical protein
MACPFYRERWIGDGEVLEGRTVLYHVICLQNTPPATIDEQQCCLESRTSCWRLRAKRRTRAATPEVSNGHPEGAPDAAYERDPSAAASG